MLCYGIESSSSSTTSTSYSRTCPRLGTGLPTSSYFVRGKGQQFAGGIVPRTIEYGRRSTLHSQSRVEYARALFDVRE